MTQTLETGKKTTLSKVLNPADTVMDVATAPTVTKGRVYLFNGQQEERCSYNGVVGNQLQNVVRNLSTTAIPATAGTGLKWIAGTRVKFVAMHDQLVDRGEDITFTGKIDFGSNQGRLKFPAYTTAQRDAILTWENGEVITNTTTGTDQQYLTGAWTDFGSSTTPNASTTVAGKVEIATPAQRGSGTGTGETGALLVPSNDALVKTSSGASDENKIPVLDANGKIAQGFLPASESLFGNGSDGVQGDADLVITGSNNTFITKNFSSWTAGSVARTVTITPTNCCVWIKIKGNANFTNWTFNFQGAGGPGGAQQTSGIGNVGIAGNNNKYYALTANGTGGALGATSATGGVGGAKLSNSLNVSLFGLDQFNGAGGGSGGSNPNGGGFGGFGGAGGAGGGSVIITVGGDVVFTSCTVNVAGANGSNGTNGTGGASGGGGGGGGGGGTAVVLYSGTATGSLTPTVSGGAGGAGGTGAGTTAGAGGGAGGSLFNAGANGSNTSSASTGGAGGAGGAGVSLVQKI